MKHEVILNGWAPWKTRTERTRNRHGSTGWFSILLITLAFLCDRRGFAANSATVPVARTNAGWVLRHEAMYAFEHPTPLGHRVWAEAIEPKVAELIGDKPIAPTVATTKPVRVLVWDEQQPQQKQAYGDKFLGETIAVFLGAQPGLTVKAVNLGSPEQGLDEATLEATDVVIWWGHIRQPEVADVRAERIVGRVKEGKLALIALHSAHWSKPFVRLMQARAKSDAIAQVPAAERAAAQWEYSNEVTTYQAPKREDPLTPSLSHAGNVWRLALPICVFPAYRPDGAPSHVTTLLPQHPIAAGLPAHWEVAHTEMYDEPFHVPPPDAVVFEERWDKGERFRSGCLWQIGKGRVFYFRPGHETYPVYQQAEPLRVIANAVRWLGTEVNASSRSSGLETIRLR